ncbi:MAG: molecular chaperone DnaJ [Candidatus Binatia bacterium]
MAKKDLYTILGLSRTASTDEIKKAYRQLARKYHPDVNPGNKDAEERFKDISFAHDVLSDNQKRKLYDEFGEEGLQPGFDPEKMRAYRQWSATGGGGFGQRGGRAAAGFGFEDVFGDILGNFGRGRAHPDLTPGEDLEYTLELDLLEVVRGASKTIAIQRPSICTTCHGTGDRPGRQSVSCPECGGQGHVRIGTGPVAFSRTCARCGGAGKLRPGGCSQCGGNGRITAPERLTVKIPAGVDEGSRIRLAGKGAASVGGGSAGDLYLEIRVRPHPTLSRKGLDLSLDLPITIGEAINGMTVTVPTPHGEVKLKIPANSQSGHVLRLKGKGVIDEKTNARGDLYIKLMIQVPSAGGESLRHAAEQLDRYYTENPRKDLHF